MSIQQINEWKPKTIVNERYEIIGLMGKSADSRCSSSTYLVRDITLDKKWVIKSYEYDEFDSADAIDAKTEYALFLKRLDHPNIVRIVDVFTVEQAIYIVMDYVEGTSLEQFMSTGRLLPQSVVIDIAIQLCDVLQYLHSFSPPVFFGDLHPEDIMLLSDNETVKLVNFDISKKYDENTLGHHDGVATELFIAPELLSDIAKQSTPESDIYSLGVIMYLLLSGKRNVNNDYSHLASDNPDVSQEFEAIVARATCSDENLRYHDVHDLLFDLTAYNTIVRPAAYPLADSASYMRPNLMKLKYRVLLVLEIVLLILLVILFIYVFSD